MSNALRGGRKTYGKRTLIGNFVEDGAAEGRDITSAQFQTCHMAQNYDTSARPGRFGNGLWVEKNETDTLGGTYKSSDFYLTVGKSMNQDPATAKPTEFSSDFKLKGGLKTEEEVLAYRNQWTKEDKSNRERRFQTNMNGLCLSKHGGLDRS